MDLRDRLKQIRRPAPTAGWKPAPRPEPRPWSPEPDAWSLQEVRNQYGFCYVAERSVPLASAHGNIRIEEFSGLSPATFSTASGDHRFAEFAADRAIFLDTETTGLAGGTGTYVFLLGLGYLRGGAFVVRQYLLPDFGQEAALLEEYRQLCEQFSYCVSFNGKGFDLHLLETRLVLARLSSDVRSYPHLDLLHVCRSLWKRILPDCSLVTLERRLLQFSRQGDIPQFEIPQRYFSYLRSGDIGWIEPVLRHNYWDMVSLVGLAVQVGRALQAEPSCFLGADHRGAGRLFVRIGDTQAGAESYRRAADHAGNSLERFDALEQLALLFKRQRRRPEAEEIWRRLTADRRYGRLAGFEELAKIQEHSSRDLAGALETVREAEFRLAGRWQSQEIRQRWRRRRERIERKMAARGK